MSSLLQIASLSGGYSYKQPVLHDISFQVNQGEVVGLIGLNGAGKSTTIKHILGLLEPIDGEIILKGQRFLDDREAYRQSCVYIPEMPALYEQLTLWEHLELTAMAYHLEASVFQERVYPLLEEFHMSGKTGWFPGHFSKGMRQKVMIMCAFLVRPDIYIADEPFVGLDPIGIQSFLDLLSEAKASGAGVLLSTHILSTAEQYCDRFIMLHHGDVILSGTVDELREATGQPQASLHDIYVAARGESIGR